MENRKEYKLTATIQKSYYGKAVVIEENGERLLRSYDTIVCKIDNNGNFIRLWGGYSKTTMNHINDFRMMNGLESLYKKDWDKLPCNNTEQYRAVFSNGFTTWKAGAIFDSYEQAEQFCDSVTERSGNRYLVAWVE